MGFREVVMENKLVVSGPGLSVARERRLTFARRVGRRNPLLGLTGRGAVFLGGLLLSALAAGGGLYGNDEAGKAEEVLARLEWRGILVLPGETLFSLHDKETKESFWIDLHGAMAGVEVVDYDGDANELTVRYGEATRALGLSGSAVAALDAEASAEAETPLGEADDSEEMGEEGGPGSESADAEAVAQEGADLWRQAVEDLPRLREIDERFRALESEEAELKETLATLEPGQPEYESAVRRRGELQEERRLLTELALTEVRASPSLAEEVRESLAERLRADYAARLLLPRPAPVESGRGDPSTGEGRSAEENSSPDDESRNLTIEDNPN